MPSCELVVIVPYRDRPSHLVTFVPAISAFLDTHEVPHRLVIVNQGDSLPFNRGALINVGVLETSTDVGWICFHDVDMLPESDSCDYSRPSHPTHLAACVQQFGYKLPYRTFFGGVVVMGRDVFHAVNGCSNEYWGWGREDDDLFLRLLASKFPIVRKPGRYKSLPHPPSRHPKQLTVNTNRLLATLMFTSAHISGADRHLLSAINSICSRYSTQRDEPRDPRCDGLSTLTYSVRCKASIGNFMSPLQNVVSSRHEVITVVLREGYR